MGQKIKILVLEDDPKLLEVLVEVLSEHDYDVTAASSGEEAVAKALESSFDLIIADIRMEGMSGLDAVAKSRERQPDMGTLIVSGYATPDDMARAMQLQGGKILAKPFKIKDFLRRVEEQLALRQKYQASRSRASRSETELLWAVNALAEALDRPAVAVPVRYFRALAEGMARTAGLAEEVCLEAGLAAALLAHQEVSITEEFLENTTSLATLKYCLAHHDDPPEEAAGLRLEARIVAFVLEVVTEDWQPDHPPPVTALAQPGLSPDLFELYQAYQSGGSARNHHHSEQEQFRSALSLAHTLRQFGRMQEARKAFKQLYERCQGRQRLTAILGLAKLELAEGNQELVAGLAQEALKEAHGSGPVSYATTLLACGLLFYQAGKDASSTLREAIVQLSKLRFDGSVALAAIAMADLGHQPNPEKLQFFLTALVQSRYAEEVMASVDWLVPAAMRLLTRLKDPENSRALLRLLAFLGPGVLDHLRAGKATQQEKLSYLESLERHSGLGAPAAVLEELSVDRDASISKRACALMSDSSTSTESPVIRCRSFGVFQVSRGTEAVPDADWKTKKVRYYFAYMASAWGSYLSDDAIIEMFWPGKSPEKGKQNLYWATSILRKCLAGDDPGLKNLVERREESLRLSPEVNHWHDLQEFEALLAAGSDAQKSEDWARARNFLSQMTELYTGPYLEGYHQDWAETKREQIALRFREGLGMLAQACLQLEDYSGALEAAYRLLELDPTMESGHEYAMRSFMGRGDFTRAIQQYEQLHKLLADEFGLEPSAELLDLYDQAFAQEQPL